MARIELRDCTIYLKDGLSGTALITEGDRAVATLDINSANGDLTFTAPDEGTEYNSIVFETNSNGAEQILYDVNTDTFTLEYNAATSNGSTMKTAFDTAIGLNPTWPQFTCDIQGTGGGTWEAVDDGVNTTSAGGLAEPVNTDTSVSIGSVVLNTLDTDLVPVGARFLPSTAGHTTVHTVTARTPANTGPTTEITFTPAWGANTPEKGDTLTFQSQQLEIKVGEGNLTYTEAKEYEYLLDRGNLDTVREGDEQPLEIELEFVYEFVTTGTGEVVTPVDALKQQNGAAEWVSSSSDQCEPFAVDVVIEHNPPCGTAESEVTTLPDFRYESLEFNLSDATIATSGRCNASEASIARE